MTRKKKKSIVRAHEHPSPPATSHSMQNGKTGFLDEHLPPPAISHSLQNGKTGFFDLSAEIRNEIYHLALVSPHDIEIARDITRGGKRYFYTVQRHSAEHVVEKSSPGGVNLLPTCRQIKKEATPVLYGANTFIVHWKDILNQFTANTLPLVRSLKITSLARKGHIDAVFVKLGKCISEQRLHLVKLSLECEFGNDPPTAKVFAKKMAPLIRAMVAAGKSIDEAINMVELSAEYSWDESERYFLRSNKAANYPSRVVEALRNILQK